jgi:hypothetical protein
MRSGIATAVAVIVLLSVLMIPVQLTAQAIFKSFDPPNSVATYPYSVNSTGTVTGSYQDAAGVQHGFLRSPRGTIVAFDAPGAGTGFGQGTLAFSISAAGVVTGFYIDASSVNHGFLRAPEGTFTIVDAPGGGTKPGQGTVCNSINSVGAITGDYVDPNYAYHGFLRAPDGTLTTFDATGAFDTFPNSINSEGIIAGHLLSNGSHGFLRAPDGTITTFDAPGATHGTDPRQCSYPCGPEINSVGAIAGTYQDASFVFHGYLRAPDGTITTFDAPGAGTGANQGTYPSAMTPTGIITGDYLDAAFLPHGFLRGPGGTIVSFDAPGGTSTATIPLGINPAGTITGYYYSDAAAVHGFVLSRSRAPM